MVKIIYFEDNKNPEKNGYFLKKNKIGFHAIYSKKYAKKFYNEKDLKRDFNKLVKEEGAYYNFKILNLEDF